MTPPPAPSKTSASAALAVALTAWTFATGLVDAITYLRLEHVFTANMTGNVVFLGFALAGDAEIPVGGVLAAVGGFAVGALLCGRVVIPRARGGALVLVTVAAQLVLTLAALVVVGTAGLVIPVLTALLGGAMGMQNAAARKLAVPDMTTTVLTLTVTGVAADATPWAKRWRRLGMVALMLAGAAVGALVSLRVSVPAAVVTLIGVLVVTAVAAVAEVLAERRPAAA